MRTIAGILLALILLSMSGCASSAPEGFSIAIQMTGVHQEVIDHVRLEIVPREAGRTFRPGETVPSDSGVVSVWVNDRGALVIDVPGTYVRDHSISQDPLSPRFELEVWSDDGEPRMGPGVSIEVERAEVVIADGAGYLPSWPLPLGESTQLNVSCRPGQSDACSTPE